MSVVAELTSPVSSVKAPPAVSNPSTSAPITTIIPADPTLPENPLLNGALPSSFTLGTKTDRAERAHGTPTHAFFNLLIDGVASAREQIEKDPTKAYSPRTYEEALCLEYGLKEALNSLNFEDVNWLMRTFQAPRSMLEKIAFSEFQTHIRKGNLNEAEQIAHFCQLKPSKLVPLVKLGITDALGGARWTNPEVTRCVDQALAMVDTAVPARANLTDLPTQLIKAFKLGRALKVPERDLVSAVGRGISDYLARELVSSHSYSDHFLISLVMSMHSRRVSNQTSLIGIALTRCMLEGNIAGARLLQNEFKLPEKVLQRALKNASLQQLGNETLKFSLSPRLAAPLVFKLLASRESGQTALYLSALKLVAGDWRTATEIRKNFPCAPELLREAHVQKLALSGLKTNLLKGSASESCNIIDHYQPAPAALQARELRSAACECIAMNLQNREHSGAAQVARAMNLPREELLKVVIPVYLRYALTNNPSATELKDLFQIEPTEVKAEFYPKSIQELCRNLNLNNFEKLFDFARKEPQLTARLVDKPGIGCLLDRNTLRIAKTMHIPCLDAEELLQAGVKLETLSEPATDPATREQQFKEVFKLRNQHCSGWKVSHINDWLETGAKALGYERMARFMERGDTPPHDMLFAIDKIVQLYKSSTLTPDKFLEYILLQVKMDRSPYEIGKSYNHFNSIAQSLNLDFSKSLNTARKYPEFPQLQELVQNFDTAEKIFSSWKSLKRFADLSKFLSRTTLLDALSELKRSGRTTLYNYIETLAFHESSNVNLELVTQFWRDPRRFLDIEEGRACHRKKPSNYTHMPHLDLSPEQLRDALVEGKMDRLQVFTPMKIVYQVPVSGTIYADTRCALAAALGSQAKQIAGEARNVGKVFAEANRLLRAEGKNLKDYLAGAEAGAELESKLLQLVYHPDFGIPRQTLQFEAELHCKSDPLGVLAGNDTACCMPFGSGKNNVYTFNLNTAHFTIRYTNVEGSKRTIAQSVITKDKDIQMPIPKALRMLESEQMNLAQIVPESVLRDAPTYLACDNIEVAQNFKTGIYPGIIERLYRDFFREYMERYAAQQNLTADRVLIGLNYSDTMVHLPRVANTFAPLAPASYSDNTGESVLTLSLAGKAEALIRTVTASDLPRITPEKTKVRGVEHLDFRHTLEVAFLEGKIYDENKALMVFLHDIENSLIAAAINNQVKQRPNLNLLYKQGGRVHGYLLAYEGRHNGEENPELKGLPIIYVSDIAARDNSSLAGGKLMRGLLEVYREQYLQKGNPISIYGEFREHTSYKLLKAHLDDMAKELGITFELQEFKTYQEGKDVMHPVLIRVKAR